LRLRVKSITARIRSGCLVLLGASFQLATAADKFPTLHVGDQTYTNVTVTSVTLTDIYFTHRGGMGNARLKTLSPELQRRFNFDTTKSEAAEKAQAEASSRYYQIAATNRTSVATTNSETHQVRAPTIDAAGDLVVADLFADSYRGTRPPTIYVEHWLTPPPETAGKSVLVMFWATWVKQSCDAIPVLNELHTKLGSKLIVIGLSNESTEDMQKLAGPRPNFYIGTDPQSRTLTALNLRAVPHALLIDPEGIVRYEGHPLFLEAEVVARLLSKYAK
jgi:hypothetical protein